MKLPLGDIRKALPLGIGYAALVLGQILLARGAGPELFGRYSLVLAWVNVAVLLAVAGFQFSATKVLPRLAAAGASSAARFAVVDMIRSVVALSAVSATLLLAVVAVNPLGLAPAGLAHFWPALALVPLIALSNVRVAMATALGRLWTGQIPDNVLRPVLIGVSVLLLSRAGYDLDIPQLILLTVTAYSLSAVVGGLLLWRALPAPGGEPYDAPGIRAELRRVAVYMGATNVFIGCARSIDIALVGALVAPAELAVYVAITRIADIVNLAYVLADPLFLPRIAASSLTPAGRSLVDDVNHYRDATTAWSLLCILVLLIGGGQILQAFGPQYEHGRLALIIASIGLSVNAWTGPGGQLLTFLGHERQNLISTVACLILYLVALVPLVYSFGIEGAAAATLLYQLLRGFVQAWLVKRLCGLEITLLRGRSSRH